MQKQGNGLSSSLEYAGTIQLAHFEVFDEMGPVRLASENSLVAQDAVKGRSADAELAGRAQFVPIVELENPLDVPADNGMKIEIGPLPGFERPGLNLVAG